jgi:hypothetical protein
MKTSASLQSITARIATGLLVASGLVAQSHAQSLQGQLVLRPLTAVEIETYALTNVPGIQRASGLDTVGIGQPAYLEVLINNAVPTANVTNVLWTLTTKPGGSSAVLAASPLGTNIPTFKMGDRTNSAGAALYKVAGPNARIVLTPDVVGQYQVNVTVQTTTSGSTNLSKKITGATYLGANTCALCHSGGLIAENQYSDWFATKHAHTFENAISGYTTNVFTANELPFRVLGHDGDTNTANGGFDDIAAAIGWNFPAALSPTNWTAMNASLKAVANVQCESCHGPGSEHAYALGNTNVSNWPRLSTSYVAGDCAQCHDSKTANTAVNTWNNILTEWNGSHHARATRTPTGPTRMNCVRCHTAMGFAQFIEHAGTTNIPYVTNTTYEAISCAACHDPHDPTNPHQLRSANVYTLPEGTTVTNVGLGALCMECHHSRNGAAEQNITNYKLGLPTWANGSSFGVHDSTAGDMVEGVNAITYGKYIPSGSHSAVIQDVCVGCHMQPVSPDDPAFGQAGGHTYSMSYRIGTNTFDKVDVCVKCHGQIGEFNFARRDYDGDGVIQGVQTEVQNLLNQLSRLLPNSTYRADGNYVADGLVKSSVSVRTNWPTKFLQAAWNWQFVNADRSLGVHNAPYAVGVLNASIADLTDDADRDGLSDAWEIAMFGSITLYDGNSDPDNDGVNNALEFSAGTNPLLADSDGDGINDLAELKAGSDPTNALDIPGFIVKIYTAAEIEFASQIGLKYQVQTVSDITGSWINVGAVTNGTGNNISMVTSTRTGGTQGYFRVVQVP